MLTPLTLLICGFTLSGLWMTLSTRLRLSARIGRIIPWVLLLVAALLGFFVLPRYPISTWDTENFAQAPGSFSLMIDQGTPLALPVVAFDQINPFLALFGLLLTGVFGAFGLSLFNRTAQAPKLALKDFLPFIILLIIGLGSFAANDAITAFLTGLSNNWLFLIAILVATLSGAGLGSLMEFTLIRPLYSRPIYQLMLTLGMSAIGIEVVRAIWGRPEFTMPKPALFSGSGAGCPATTFSAWWENNCSIILLLEGRVRVYNEIFIPLVGIVVLVAVWILLQRTRLGMVIRAGVQDREMVEALGINVRRVFTLVFALGVGLAALGGVLAAPSMGLSNMMGESLLLNALIALAIGGLTSYPGAALGSLLVGLLQQFMIKYGQIGIAIPFTEIVFKPTPPIVPASTVLLMVIILLILPNGLLGKKE
jgi:branched-chain amino acid transport system permease protein